MPRSQDKLQAAKAQLSRACELVGPCRPGDSPVVVALSLDVEWWELDKELVLELGWSCWDTLTHTHRTRHWKVRGQGRGGKGGGMLRHNMAVWTRQGEGAGQGTGMMRGGGV